MIFCTVCDRKIEEGVFYEVQIATCRMDSEGKITYPTYSAKMFVCNDCKKEEDAVLDPLYRRLANTMD